MWPEEVIAEVKRIRWAHPNLGKEKLYPELLKFCLEKGIECPKPKTIGRLIRDLGGLRMYPSKISHFGKIKPAKRRNVLRKPKDFEAEYPGHCAAPDTIEKHVWGRRYYVITFEDLFTRFSFAWETTSHASLAAKEFFTLCLKVFPFPITFVLTDNGSEFMKHFDEELRRMHMIHYHTYPKTPKTFVPRTQSRGMNAHCERFNRTIQEEFVDYNTGLLVRPNEFNRKLIDWLVWYNTDRVHYAFQNKLSPVQFMLQLPQQATAEMPAECKSGWSYTFLGKRAHYLVQFSQMTPTKQAQLQHHLTEIRRSAEERAAQKIAKETNHGYVDVRITPVSIDALQVIPETEARDAYVVGLQIKTDVLAIGAADPEDPKVSEIQKKLEAKGFKIKVYAVSKSGIEEACRLYKLVAVEKADITGKVQVEEDFWEKFKTKLLDFKSAGEFYKGLKYQELDTTDLFEIVLAGAMALKGSDIHLEAEEKGARFRYRIDGILHDVATGVPKRNYNSLISRLKLISGLKINVRTETQDGRFTIRMVKKDIEVRVSIVPSQYGETVVMRLLDPDGINVTLEQLGFRADDYELVKAELLRPNGLILNTGPTGSGKTTTLYTFLRTVSSPDIKIITIEDPVEYHLPGIEQTQTDIEAGYTFASGLRAMMRQDPDIILVGEVRDLETAEIAMNASLTGHLVFSTLHTNDAIGAVPRLLDLGVKPAILGPALSLVIAQRLVRKLCENCKKAASPSSEDAGKYRKFLDKLPKRIDRAPFAEIKVFEAGGCEKCNGFGYKGRLGIYEFFKKTPELEELISQGVSIISLRKLAKDQEMVFLQQDGILKVFLGITSFEEVVGVTGPIEW